jgi:hypothetical protein
VHASAGGQRPEHRKGLGVGRLLDFDPLDAAPELHGPHVALRAIGRHGVPYAFNQALARQVALSDLPGGGLP